MKQISNQDKNLIQEAVSKAEKSTSGEIVPAILKMSDDYPASHFRSAIFFSLLITWAVYYIDFEIMDDTIFYLWLQLPGLILGYYLVQIPFLKQKFSSKKEFTEETHQRAVELFLENNLHSTRDRTGVLIFISLLEKRVEIIADEGINKLVPKDAWDNIVEKIIVAIKADNLTNGVCEAIADCGKLLSINFPIKNDDTNEISNKVVTD